MILQKALYTDARYAECNVDFFIEPDFFIVYKTQETGSLVAEGNKELGSVSYTNSLHENTGGTIEEFTYNTDYHLYPDVSEREINTFTSNSPLYNTLRLELLRCINDSLHIHQWYGYQFTNTYSGYWRGGQFVYPDLLAMPDTSVLMTKIPQITGENLGINFPYAPMLSWRCFDEYVDAHSVETMEVPSESLQLGLYKLREDIKNGLIECSDELKNRIFEDLEAGLYKNDCATWYVNIDGVKEPTISVTWELPNVDQFDNVSATIYTASMAFNTFVSNDLEYYGRYGYDNGVVKFNWAEMYRGTDPNALQKVDQFLQNLNVKQGYVAFGFEMTYFNEQEQVKTCLMAITISNTGEYSTYTLGEPDGSKIVVTRESTNDFYEDFDDVIDDIDIGSYGVSGLALLTKTYVMTTEQLRQLGQFIWNDDFCDNIKLLNNSPIENIISCKAFPFAITAGESTTVQIGNVDTGVNGKKLESTYDSSQTIGTFKIAKKYNNFLDYEFTAVGIFLPFIGFRELPVSEIMDKTITVKYYNDLISGTCKAVIEVNSIPTMEFSGQTGIDVPLTASNNTQYAVAQFSNALGLVSQGIGVLDNVMSQKPSASGIAQGVIGMAQTGLQLATQPHTFTTAGQCGALVNSFTTHDVFLIIERPQVQYPSNYNHTFGKPCNLSLGLNSLKGFTKCVNVDVSTISATEEEKAEIKAYLESGVYL